MVPVRPYVTYVQNTPTKELNQASALAGAWVWIIERLKMTQVLLLISFGSYIWHM